jgi:hypothetical protein
MKTIQIAVLTLCLSVLTAAQVIPDCSSAGFNSFCNQVTCNYHESPASGCLGLFPGCQACYRGDFLFGGGDDSKFDPTTQAAGVFQPFTWKGQTYERFIITNPGVLVKHNIKRGDVLRRIDGQRVTTESLEGTFTHKPERVESYTPGVGVRKTATLRKAA